MSAQYTITFQAGDVRNLNLKDISGQRFTRLYENRHGVLQGTINTGLAWGRVVERPLNASWVPAECGLCLFEPGDLPTQAQGFYLLGIIEYLIDGRVGYLARVREVPCEVDASDPAFRNQYVADGTPTDLINMAVVSSNKSVAFALDQWLRKEGFDEVPAWSDEYGRLLAAPTLAEYADEE